MNISCSGDADQLVNGDTQSVSICTLTVVDSIGLAFGDSNYAFGSVQDVYLGPDGRTYVLDKIQLTVFVYDAGGKFIRRFGRPGSGPGDLDNPCQIAVLGDGTICIADGINGWLTYDSSGQNVSMHSLGSGTRGMMVAVDSTDVVGRQSEYRRLDDGRHAREMTLCRWDVSDPDSMISVYYYEEYIRAGGADFAKTMQEVVSFNMNPPFLFAAGDGFVCVAPEPSDDPVLLLFNENGSMIDTLYLPYEVVPKTQFELEEERAYIEGHYNNLMSGYGIHFEWEWEPALNHPMISSVGVDSLNRIWVQRGFEQKITIDVYNQNSEHLMTAVLPNIQSKFHWEVYINENGIAAVPQDPLSHYVIYRLALKN